MSAQRRQDYGISPPRKTASNNLKRFCSTLFCCSILGGIVACQNNNSSVKDSTLQSANSVANQRPTFRSPQVNIAEKSLTLQPSVPSSKAKNSTPANPKTAANIYKNDRVFDASEFLSAPNSDFSVDTQDALIQEQTTPVNPVTHPNSQKNSVTEKQINQEEQTNKNEKLTKAISKVKTPQIYQSQQLGFSFKYPKGYVINKAQHNPNIEASSVQQRINVWSRADYQAIKAGKFQGSELPANVSISVEKNPKRLNASQWLKENNHEFGATQNQNKQVVAGQKAVAFRSSGLYETQNIVLPSRDGKNVIVISHFQNQNDSDKDYEQVFERVVSSFELRVPK